MGKVKKTIDKESPLVYKGRKFKIESNGTGTGTHVYIEGEEVQCLKSLTLDIAAGQVNIIRMESLDLL
jgi:hypothetical protein